MYTMSQTLMEALTALQSYRKDPGPRGYRILVRKATRIAKHWHDMATKTGDSYHHDQAHKSHKDLARLYGAVGNMAAERGLDRIARVAHAKASKYDERAATHLQQKGGNA